MMMKKAKCVGILSIVILLLVTSAFAQTVSVMDAKGAPGATVSTELHCTDGGDMSGINFTITYDPAILSNPQVTLGDLAADFTLDQNVPTAGELRAVIYPPSAPVTNFKDDAGAIANIAFTVAGDATHCSTTNLTLADGSEPEKMGVSDKSGVSTTGNYTLQSGTFQVTLPGDINNDGSVNMIDYSVMSAYWGNPYNMIDYSKMSAYWGQKCD
jgi:hypothetical protein